MYEKSLVFIFLFPSTLDITYKIMVCAVKVFVAATPFSIPASRLILELVSLTSLESLLLTIDNEFLKCDWFDSNSEHTSAVSPLCEIKMNNLLLLSLTGKYSDGLKTVTGIFEFFSIKILPRLPTLYDDPHPMITISDGFLIALIFF